jgi:hypothetical protein
MSFVLLTMSLVGGCGRASLVGAIGAPSVVGGNLPGVIGNYSSGTWTPNLQYGTTDINSTASGIWVRIGNMVFVQTTISFSEDITSGGTAQINIDNLPLTVDTTSVYKLPVAWDLWSVSGDTGVQCRTNGANSCAFWTLDMAGGGVRSLRASDANVAGTKVLNIFGWYLTV